MAGSCPEVHAAELRTGSRRAVLGLVPVLALLTAAAAADTGAHSGLSGSDWDADSALARSQAALGRQVGDYRFRDRRGRTVRLADFRGRPLIVSFIYTACTHTCPVITQTLVDIVDTARDVLGDDAFAVATVGFDAANDTPRRMNAFARQQGVSDSRWRFLSADRDTVAGLADDLGFVFFPSPQGFDHLAQTTVLDAEGRVHGQIYGQDFAAPQLVEPLKQILFGGSREAFDLTGLVDRVRLFCTVYDPAAERYKFDYSIFIGMAIGAVSLTVIGVILVRAWWRTRPTRPA